MPLNIIPKRIVGFAECEVDTSGSIYRGVPGSYHRFGNIQMAMAQLVRDVKTAYPNHVENGCYARKKFSVFAMCDDKKGHLWYPSTALAYADSNYDGGVIRFKWRLSDQFHPAVSVPEFEAILTARRYVLRRHRMNNRGSSAQTLNSGNGAGRSSQPLYPIRHQEESLLDKIGGFLG